MLSSYIDKHIVCITKFIEGVLTILNMFILCAQLFLLFLCFKGTIYFADDTKQLYFFLLSLWGISIAEIFFSLIQRILVRVADPYPISRLNAVMSPAKASMRFLFRLYFQSFFYLFLIAIFEFYRKKWLGDLFPGGSWGKFVSFWYGFTPFTSIAAKAVHTKFWKMLMD